MEIREVQQAIEARFAELGDPTSNEVDSCCPLGLMYGDPNDLSPEPEKVSEKTGLPERYCKGLAEGWDGKRGFYVHNLGTHRQRNDYFQGLRDGERARERWLKEHPRVKPASKDDGGEPLRGGPGQELPDRDRVPRRPVPQGT